MESQRCFGIKPQAILVLKEHISQNNSMGLVFFFIVFRRQQRFEAWSDRLYVVVSAQKTLVSLYVCLSDHKIVPVLSFNQGEL